MPHIFPLRRVPATVLYHIADSEFPADGSGHIETSITHLETPRPLVMTNIAMEAMAHL